MTTVVQTTYPQQSYPPPQNAAPYPATSYPPQPGTAVVQLPATTTTTTNRGSSKYSKKAGVITGVMQLIAAGLLVLLGIIILSLSALFHVGWNIWGSICFYMVSGILGIVSKNQNKCVIVAYMVMSILSAVCAGGQMIFDSTTASIYSYYSSDCQYRDYNPYYHTYTNDPHCEHATALYAVFAISALLGFGEMVVAIVAASFCCCGVCGTSTPSQITVVTLATQPAPGTTYPVSASPAYPPQGQVAQPPPSYTYAPPPQPQPQQGQQVGACEEVNKVALS